MTTFIKEKSEMAIEKLKKLQGPGDTESQHWEADKVLCDLLRGLGYNAVVDEWQQIDRWYA